MMQEGDVGGRVGRGWVLKRTKLYVKVIPLKKKEYLKLSKTWSSS